jgi:hypothetical protein
VSEGAAAGTPPPIFLLPHPNLGRTEDVRPERLTSTSNEWIAHTREILEKKRKAARAGQWAPTTPISENHPHLQPFGAEFCPAIKDLDSIGLLLKWPATALLRQVTPKGWQLKPSTNYNFYRYSPLTSFAESGEAEAILVETGWTVVTPPGWSVLLKNVPNDLSGSPRGLVFAEGIVRTDQVTLPLATHVFIRSNAKEIKIKRGDPMAVLFPFRRQHVGFEIVDDEALLEEAARLTEKDRATFANAPGGYTRLYVDDTNPSPLYPKLVESWREREESKGR